MKVTSAELKSRAKITLTGHYGLCIGAQFLVSFLMLLAMAVYSFAVVWNIISSLDYGFGYRPYASGAGLVGIIAFLPLLYLIMAVLQVMSAGVKKMYINISAGEGAGIGDIFYGYTHKMHRFIGYYFITILANLILQIPYIILSVIPLFSGVNALLISGLAQLAYIFELVGVIIFNLFFSQTILLMLDDTELGVIPAMKESARLMKGHKGDLFYLYFSFIGVMCLGVLTFGIGFLWLTPYRECTVVHFYLELREEDMRMRRQEYGYPGMMENGGYEMPDYQAMGEMGLENQGDSETFS